MISHELGSQCFGTRSQSSTVNFKTMQIANIRHCNQTRILVTACTLPGNDYIVILTYECIFFLDAKPYP